MPNIFGFIKALLRLSSDIKFAKGGFALVIVLSVLSGLANTALLAVITESLSQIGEFSAQLAWTFAALCVGLPLVRVLSQAMLLRLGEKAALNLRLNLAGRILSAPLRRLEKLGPDRLLASLVDDIDGVTDAIMDVPMLIMHLTVVVGCLAYLGWLAWPVLLGVLLFLVIGLVTYQLPVRKASHHLRIFREQWDSMMKHMRALTQGSKEMKLHRARRHAFLNKLLRPLAESQARHAVTGNTIFAIAINWGQILYFVVIGLVIFVLPQYYDVSLETLAGYALTILYLRGPLEGILILLPNLTTGSIAIKKVEQLGLSLTSSNEETALAALPAPVPEWRGLELRDVTYDYNSEVEQENFVVGPINLRIEPNEIVFLIGGNGSGKTTLGKLLTGLYAPDGGQILLDGKPVDESNRDDYRQLFSVVFSDFFIFETLLGLETPQLDDQAREYLSKLQLSKKVSVADGALSTVELSQGQRKRLALLTAYLEDRPIYLFDEWAADQDPVFKQTFYYKLLPELKERGKTVIVISHDDRYYEVGDRVIKISDGRLVDAV